MVKVAVVTDSAAALPAEMIAAHDITVVPMWLTLDGRSVREDDVTYAETLGAHRVTTSGPSPGEFDTAIKECETTTDDGVCVCTIASTMSSTYRSAVLAARAADGPVRVVDTMTAAGAEALVVLAAAEAAEAGASLDEVEAAAARALGQVRLVATLPSLDHLVRSGRVPNIAAWAGRRLGIAPLFEFRAGGAHPLRPALGRAAALDRMISRWRRDRIDGARLHIAVLHAEAEPAANELLARVRAEAEPDVAFVGSFGAVMLTHTGPGLVGLAWRWDPPA